MESTDLLEQAKNLLDLNNGTNLEEYLKRENVELKWNDIWELMKTTLWWVEWILIKKSKKKSMILLNEKFISSWKEVDNLRIRKKEGINAWISAWWRNWNWVQWGVESWWNYS